MKSAPRFFLSSILGIGLFLQSPSLHSNEPESDKTHTYDLVVYGGTSAAVIAAVQAKKMGKSVVIVGPDKHLGGLSSGGLGFTDTGNKAVIGGLSRDFYHRVWKHYQKSEAWKWQKPEEYGNKGQGTPAIDGENRTMWIFEPHVAEAVFEDYIKEFKIPVHRDEWLDREKGVKKDGTRITQITMLSGKTYRGKMFIDATYEGDLLASAGVDYHVGREANSVYGEEFNGIQVGVLHHRHHFGHPGEKVVPSTSGAHNFSVVLPKPIDPYVIPGDPSSGILPRINPKPPGKRGEGDKGVQAYCFRMCLTNDPRNRVPFPKPQNYDPKQYELLLRVFEAGWRETFNKFDPIPNHKTDTNNHGPFSTDNIGYNHDYPDASYERRKEIIQEHVDYQQGWFYFIANDPRVPKEVQEEMRKWGLAKDEFLDNNHWPHQLYIREARRMIGEFVMTENELRKKKPTPNSVGMGSYTIDSHNVHRYITAEGYVQNEGDIGVSTNGPYEIAYGALVPKKAQASNLLVPVCVSSSHIAFGSIRMEPVFMILGQSAATAAVFAIDQNLAVQDVPYETLRAQLLKDGQVLEAPPSIKPSSSSKGIPVNKLQGIVVDDTEAQLIGDWKESSSGTKFVGTSYRHDNNIRNGTSKARFDAALPKSGKYEVRLAYTPNPNRASNAKVTVRHQSGEEKLTINQKFTPKIDELFVSLGIYEFDSKVAGVVTISNEDTDGYVIADAVQFLAK